MPYYMHELNPDYNPAVGMLQHMTTEELKQVLNDDERLEVMVKDLQQVKRNESEREMLIAGNKSLAEFNLNQEPVVNGLRNKLVEYYNQLMVLKEDVETKKQQLDDIKRQMSLDTTLALLQTAAAESEEESEATSEKFLSGEIPVEAFLEEYLKKRKCAHLRRIKAEKMVELLNQSKTSPNYSAIGGLPSTHNYPYSGYSPYPTSSAQGSMPMPYFN